MARRGRFPEVRGGPWVPHRQTLAQELLLAVPAQSRCSVNSCCRRSPRPALPWTGWRDKRCWWASCPAHARRGGDRGVAVSGSVMAVGCGLAWNPASALACTWLSLARMPTLGRAAQLQSGRCCASRPQRWCQT